MNSEEAYCVDSFEKFCTSSTFYSILTDFHRLCQLAHIQPTNFADFFPKLKAKLTSRDAQQFLAIYETKISNPAYQKGTACRDAKVLIIGAGPAGLRCAIECQLLGAKVILIEKRDIFSRNNVLHIWPFVIADLKSLGAKRFYPKFCAGSINHISISQLQNILLKIALLLGVQVHAGVGFQKLIEPSAETNTGWRISCEIDDGCDLDEISSVESQDFDVIIGANGRQCSLPGFRRKALRAKLAIAITANFINHHTAAEARVDEISGVSFIFKQSFFQDLYDYLGIDLENIVYYKDETHYFIMTAKKASLLLKGVLKQDFLEPDDLLHPSNINKNELRSYILEAVEYATEKKLQNLEFALNYRGEQDFSLFDFTSMYTSENASKIIERNGKRLILGLVGDSLLEPFWPMGTGCARGFLSAIDAAWMIRSWCKGNSPLDVISERESIFKLLAQTTQENLHKNTSGYSVEPQSRYQNVNLAFGKPYPTNILELYDTTGCTNFNLSSQSTTTGVICDPIDSNLQSNENESNNTNTTAAAVTDSNAFKNRNIITNETKSDSFPALLTTSNVTTEAGSIIKNIEVDLECKSTTEKIDFLMNWIQLQLKPLRIEVNGIHDLFVRGNGLCALLHLYRPDLIPQFPFPSDVEEGIELMDAAAFRNQLAFDFLEKEYGVHCAESGINSTLYSFTNVPVLVDFLCQLYQALKNENPKKIKAAAAAAAPSISSYQCQRKALWESQRQQEQERQEEQRRQRQQAQLVAMGKVQSIHRSLTLPSIDTKYRRAENVIRGPPTYAAQSSIRNNSNNEMESAGNLLPPSRADDGNNYSRQQQSKVGESISNNLNSEKQDYSPDHLRRLAEAENTKTKALLFINSLKQKKAEERQVQQIAKKEAAKKAIQSVEKPDACSPSNPSTLVNDDFFNEYNMRLWRKSVPTIQERSQKLENNLRESAGLRKCSQVLNSTNTTSRQDRKVPYVGKINEKAISLMQQKFAETKGYTNNVHVQQQPTSSLSKSSTASAIITDKNSNTLNEPNLNVAKDPPTMSSLKTCSSFPIKSNGINNEEEEKVEKAEMPKHKIIATNKRDGEILVSSNEILLEEENDSSSEDLDDIIVDDTIDDLTADEVNEILNWSGKYL